jgi:hypothetical protein
MKRTTSGKRILSLESLEGRDLMSGMGVASAPAPMIGLPSAQVSPLPPPKWPPQFQFPNLTGDRFVIVDGIYDNVGTLYIAQENRVSGTFQGIFIDRQLNHRGVVMAVSGRLAPDTGFYDLQFSGGGSVSVGLNPPPFETEIQTVSFGGSVDVSIGSPWIVGILDVHDILITPAGAYSSDTGEIAVAGRIPTAVPDLTGDRFAIKDQGGHTIGQLVITGEDQQSDTFTATYVDAKLNHLGVVQTVRGVIDPSHGPHGAVQFLFAGSGDASRSGRFPAHEHQYVTYDGTVQGSGRTATLAGTIDVNDRYTTIFGTYTADTGPITTTGSQ